MEDLDERWKFLEETMVVVGKEEGREWDLGGWGSGR